jgi:hypothetical protein
VSKFGGAKIRGPISLVEITEGTEVLFKFLIKTFGLAIRLGVIGGRHGLGNTKEVA